jgi:hypothetical protein
MRNLLKIILGGLAAFMVLAVAQQWGYFSSVWFGGEADIPQTSEEEKTEAAEAVRNILVLLEHYYGTGGDPRFAERIPVSQRVLQDLQADVEYLRRNRRRQEPMLQRFEVVDVSASGPGRMTVTTREYWIHRIFWLDGSGEEAEPPHSQVISSTYSMRKQPQGWWLDRWTMSANGPPGSAEAEPEGK